MTEAPLRDSPPLEPAPQRTTFGRAGHQPGHVGAARKTLRMSQAMILRLIMLTLALGAGYGAVELASTPKPEITATASSLLPPPIETEDVLMTLRPVDLGRIISPDDLGWVAWPKTLVADQAIRRSVSGHAREEMIGGIARAAMMKGEPVRLEKIVQANGAGVLAAILPAGSRAMAISIDAQGATTAGGFILPNDRVDVIRTITRPDPSGKNEGLVQSETLIANVRVLAIGQNIQEKNGERVITGTNATLEVDPQQTELLAQAQRSGQISLALRSLRDANEKPQMNVLKSEPVAAQHIYVSVMRGAKKEDYVVRESTR